MYKSLGALVARSLAISSSKFALVKLFTTSPMQDLTSTQPRRRRAEAPCAVLVNMGCSEAGVLLGGTVLRGNGFQQDL
jgi:hypothetical protein